LALVTDSGFAPGWVDCSGHFHRCDKKPASPEPAFYVGLTCAVSGASSLPSGRVNRLTDLAEPIQRSALHRRTARRSLAFSSGIIFATLPAGQNAALRCEKSLRHLRKIRADHDVRVFVDFIRLDRLAMIVKSASARQRARGHAASGRCEMSTASRSQRPSWRERGRHRADEAPSLL